MPDECQKWSMEMIMFKTKPITLGSAIFNRQVSDKRRACDESSYRLHECSGSAPRDVSARALHPQLRPGGIAGPPGEDARLADQWVRVLPRCAFERRPRPRRNRAETLRARRMGGSGVLFRARTRGARAYRGRHPDHGRPCARRGLRARTSALQRTGADCAGVYPDHHQRLESPCYHDAYRGGQISTEGAPGLQHRLKSAAVRRRLIIFKLTSLTNS